MNTPVLGTNPSLPRHYFITLQHIMTHSHRARSHLQALFRGFTTSLKIRINSYRCAFVTIYIHRLALSISPAPWFTALQMPDISKLIQGLSAYPRSTPGIICQLPVTSWDLFLALQSFGIHSSLTLSLKKKNMLNPFNNFLCQHLFLSLHRFSIEKF